MVPRSLRTWFVIHFVVDILFGVPLLIAPVLLLSWFGWETVDPFMSRLVGAALLGIGVESLLGRNASVEIYREMLNL
jgi:divalent metal cation (Fe/Co/Zn/Cd) transporter